MERSPGINQLNNYDVFWSLRVAYFSSRERFLFDFLVPMQTLCSEKKLLFAKVFDGIAQSGGFFELEFLRGLAHLGFHF